MTQHLLRTLDSRGKIMTGQGLVVWYNTRCPVCDAGISRQRNKLLDAVRAGHVTFRDINEEPEALARYGVSLDDVRKVAVPVLRHRISTNFQAQAEGQSTESLVHKLVTEIREPDTPKYET